MSSLKTLHISVVIPAFNEAGLIADCLTALASQTLQPNIIYVVDNNSTDTTVANAQSYPKVVIITESTQGICASTQAGLDIAAQHGGLILRLDADCRPDHQWIEKMYHAFTTNPGVAAITGPGVAYDARPVQAFLIDRLYMKPYFTLVRLALGQKPLFGSNFGIRASAWRQTSATTHLKDHQDIHDDIDISYHLPDTILYMPELSMPISARPFRSLRSMVKRYAAGFRSIFIHWPQQAPWKNR